MIKAFSLTTNIIIAELEKYHYCKNIDPAILLPEKYHKYLNVFCKQKADMLPIYCLYNHAIKIKESYQPSSAVMYRMNRDKIQKLRQYLEKNLAKRFI